MKLFTKSIDDENRTFRRLMIAIAVVVIVLQVGAFSLLVRAFLL